MKNRTFRELIVAATTHYIVHTEVSKLQQLGVAVASLTSETRHNDKAQVNLPFYCPTGVCPTAV